VGSLSTWLIVADGVVNIIVYVKCKVASRSSGTQLRMFHLCRNFTVVIVLRYLCLFSPFICRNFLPDLNKSSKCEIHISHVWMDKYF
jgi:hypothetical protein